MRASLSKSCPSHYLKKSRDALSLSSVLLKPKLPAACLMSCGRYICIFHRSLFNYQNFIGVSRLVCNAFFHIGAIGPDGCSAKIIILPNLNGRRGFSKVAQNANTKNRSLFAGEANREGLLFYRLRGQDRELKQEGGRQSYLPGERTEEGLLASADVS